jgi:hypothetical protein
MPERELIGGLKIAAGAGLLVCLATMVFVLAGAPL